MDYCDFVDTVLHTCIIVYCNLQDIFAVCRVRVESWDELHHGGKSFGPKTGVVRAGMRGSRAGPRVRPNSHPNTVAGRAGQTTPCIAAPPNTWWITDEPPNVWWTADRLYSRLSHRQLLCVLIENLWTNYVLYNMPPSLFPGDAVFIVGECLMFRLQCPRKLSCYIKIKHVNSAKPYSNRVVDLLFV